MSPDFQYKLHIDRKGDLHVGPGGPSSEMYWVDYGDVMLMKASMEVLVAKIDFLAAYDWNDVKPNDFDPLDDPDVDPLHVVETDCPEFVEMASHKMLENARDRYVDAVKSYKVGSLYIRNESPEQADNGLITLGRGAFDSDQERNLFLQEEESFRGLQESVWELPPFGWASERRRSVPSARTGRRRPSRNRQRRRHRSRSPHRSRQGQRNRTQK